MSTPLEPNQGRVSVVEWASAEKTYRGEKESGDARIVQPYPGGVMVAVIDGLGHGPEAALAARKAVDAVRVHASADVRGVLQRCHDALLGTRGAVMTIATFGTASATMKWSGVGNVEGVVVRKDRGAVAVVDTVVPRGGVIGYQLPQLAESTVAIRKRDLAIFATDGIREGFARDVSPESPPEELAQTILARSATGKDDALVLVVRYLGAPP